MPTMEFGSAEETLPWLPSGGPDDGNGSSFSEQEVVLSTAIQQTHNSRFLTVCIGDIKV
jgi:hypothetical protein